MSGTDSPGFTGPAGCCVGSAFGVWQIAAAQSAREAVLAADRTRWTFGHLAARANRSSHGLRSMGVHVGDAVALLLHNEPNALALALETAQIGAYLVPMNWHLTPPELSYLLSNSRAKVLAAGLRSAQAATAAADAAGLPPSHRLPQLASEVRGRYRLCSLHTVIHAAAPCPVPTKQRMIDWWGPILHQYCAATEGGGTVVDAAQWLQRPGTVGRPYSFASVRILGEQGQALPAGEVGTVYMQDGFDFEYLDDPAKTAAARHDGYFTAGAQGHLDSDGDLFINDRRTDLILSGGVNIYPAEIKAVMMQQPAVADAVVFGLPDEEWGQRVQAVVQPVVPGSSDGPLDEAALRTSLLAWCKAQLAGFKLPRDIAFATLPRNDVGKMARAALRAAFVAGSLGPWYGR